MIIGIGIDLVDIERFAGYINRSMYMKERLFSKSERILNVNQLAGNFAVKEALLKASNKKFDFSNCTVLRNQNGRPVLNFESNESELDYGNVLISITNTDKWALAIALIESNT